MEPSMIIALTGMVGAFGTGIGWVYTQIDAKNKALQREFIARIDEQRIRLNDQNREIDRLRDDISRYVRHVGILEGLLRSHGIDVPDMPDS